MCISWCVYEIEPAVSVETVLSAEVQNYFLFCNSQSLAFIQDVYVEKFGSFLS